MRIILRKSEFFSFIVRFLCKSNEWPGKRVQSRRISRAGAVFKHILKSDSKSRFPEYVYVSSCDILILFIEVFFFKEKKEVIFIIIFFALLSLRQLVLVRNQSYISFCDNLARVRQKKNIVSAPKYRKCETNAGFLHPKLVPPNVFTERFIRSFGYTAVFLLLLYLV